ncbi:MAG: GyrI-like domain-containing protein [Alphaproteobacteria bacterium]
MWKAIGLGAAAVVAVLAGAGFILPSKTHIEKSILVNAPQEQVFATLNSIKEFNAWSPFLKMEPTATTEFSGPDAGEGASLHWVGKKLGKGSMTVVASTPETRIDYALEFGGKTGDKSWFDVKPQSGGINVTWGYESAPYGINILNRYVGALFVGPGLRKAYKSGLVDFKAYVESKAALPAAPPAGDKSMAPSPMGAVPANFSGEIVTLEAKPAIVAAGDGMGEGIDGAVKAAFGKVQAYLSAQKIAAAGPPIAITHSYDVATQRWAFDAGMPVAAAPAAPPAAADGVRAIQTHAGKTAKFKYHGDPAKSEAFYNAIFAWLKAQGLEPAGDSWEEYLSDEKTPSEEWDVDIYFPVKDAAK